MTHLQTQTSEASLPRRISPRPLVLVVDPDDSSRSVLDVALGREGFEVWSAGTASEANLLLTGRAPDVIVLESALGGDDGYTFVAALRGDARLVNVPVLLLAAAGEENEAALAEVVGVDQVIRKPAFARDITALARLELAKRTGGLTFDSQALPPERMLRALLSTPRSGRMTLASGRAELLFRSGKIVSARFGELRPSVDLVERALALTLGEYSVTLMPVAVEVELNCRLQEVVNVVVPRLARWQRALLKSLPLDMRLTTDFARLRSVKGLPADVNAVLRLFDGFRDVEQVLLDSPLSASLTLEAATRLFLMGVLTHAHDADEELLSLRPMPRLFEPPATEAKELMDKLFAGEAEIRGADDDDSPESDGDWYQPVSARDEVLGAVGGEWTSAPVPEALAAGLSDELQKHLEAFGTPLQVQERATTAPAHVPAVDVWSRDTGASALADAAPSRQAAAPGASLRERHEVTTPVPAASELREAATSLAALHATIQQNVAQTHEAEAKAEQPATAADHVRASIAAEPSFSGRSLAKPPAHAPVVSAPAQAAVSAEGDAEAAFFAASAIDENVAPPTTARRSVWPFVIGGMLLLAVAVLFESSPAETPKPEPVVVAPPAPPVDVAPAAAEAAPEPAEEPAPVEVDVSENLLLGSQLYDRGEYKKAITVLEQVVSDAPDSVNGWLQLGLARYDSGDAKGAREAAERVLALAPKNGRVHLLLATLHFDANERDLGRAAIQKYLELEPNGAHVSEAKALLR